MPKGEEMYRLAWKRIEPIKERKMRELRTADYQRIINDMEDAGLSASYAQKVKQLAGQLSKWAMRAGVKPESLTAIIGHAKYSTTVDIYHHSNLTELKEELSKISSVI